MKRIVILSVLSLLVVVSVSAQDDDMYFSPKKSDNGSNATQSRQRPSAVGNGNSGRVYGGETNNEVSYYSGSARDVDEYNRRSRYSQDYMQQEDGLSYRNDSILVSVEDYENSMKMKRFDGYHNVTLVVNDPWYYDPWCYDSYYWRSGWYWPWNYSCYDPWFHRPAWYGYWGHHGWDFGFAWHYPIYSRPIINHRPIPGRPMPGGGRPNIGYGSGRTPASVASGRKASSMIGDMRNNRTTTTRTPTSRTTTTSRPANSMPSTQRSTISSGGGGRGSFGGGSGSATRSGGGARMSRR